MIKEIRQKIWAAIELGIKHGIKPGRGLFGVDAPNGGIWRPRASTGCCGLGYVLLGKERQSNSVSASAAIELGIEDMRLIGSFIHGWDGGVDDGAGYDPDFFKMGQDLRKKAVKAWNASKR